MSSSNAACLRGGRSSHTKYYLQNLPQRVEVTRRHHPLCGCELEVIHANKVMLTIRLANGSTMKMPRAWANAGGATGVVEPLRCSVFTIEGVRELIDLVSALRRRDWRQSPEVPEWVSRIFGKEAPWVDNKHYRWMMVLSARMRSGRDFPKKTAERWWRFLHDCWLGPSTEKPERKTVNDDCND